MNNNFKTTILATFLSVVSFINSSTAQISIGLTGGAATRWSVPKYKEAIGFGYTASAKYKISERWTVGVNFSSFHFGPEEKLTDNVDYKITYYAYTGMVEYHLLTKARFRPYFGMDFGAYNYYTVTTIDLGQSGKQRQVLNKTYPGFAPTVGANYSLAKNFFLNGGLKFNTVIIKEAAPIGYASISVGIFYAFNK